MNDFNYFPSTPLATVTPSGWNFPTGNHPAVHQIGQTRSGSPLHAILLGHGPLHITITAGAHADEPIGPRTALFLANQLAHNPAYAPWLEAATWWIVPHANPDLDPKNAGVMASPNFFPLDQALHLIRETPEHDVEFHYPMPEPSQNAAAPRPENLAIAEFLRLAAPIHLHLSLHSMSFASGAWYLICEEWAHHLENSPERKQLESQTRELGLPLMDWDRAGEKGFRQILRGFSTTPTGRAMRQHFESEPTTDRHFLHSSMEYVQSLGGNPLCVVTEIPHFLVQLNPWDTYAQWNAELRQAKQKNQISEFLKLQAHRLKPVPPHTHSQLQLHTITFALRLASRVHNIPLPKHSEPHFPLA